jgi:hypothetical protein
MRLCDHLRHEVGDSFLIASRPGVAGIGGRELH